MNDLSGAILLIVYVTFWLLAILLLVMPAIIAFRRGHPNRWLILLVNVVLAGTVIGWLAALVWALRIVRVPGEDSTSRREEAGWNTFANDVQRVRVEPTLSSAAPHSAGTATADEVLQKIERLHQLHSAGHISEEEFVSLKTAVIGRL